MLVYDGIHYDALAISPFPNAPEEMDVTVFDPYTPEGQAIIEAATRLVSKLTAFVNSSSFRYPSLKKHISSRIRQRSNCVAMIVVEAFRDKTKL